MKNVLAMILVGVMYVTCGVIEQTYTMEGIILDSCDSSVFVEDSMGEIWEFEGEGFKCGDHVKITFHTNQTEPNRYDDKVIKCKKIDKKGLTK